MKNTIAAFLIATALVAPVAVSAQTTGFPPAGTTPAGPVTPGAPVPGGRPHEERHPEMHRALHRLEAAKEDLQHAAHDYSGHRDQAINLINQAEEQIKLGLQSDQH